MLRKIKAGFVGFGEVNTPRELIERKVSQAIGQLEGLGFELIVTPPVSDDPAYQEADRAIADLEGKPMDLLIVCIAGWIPSHAVIRVTDKFRHIPMMLWGLTGWMENGRLVTTADQAGTTALRQTFQDQGYRFKYIYNILGKPIPEKHILSFGQACRAAVLLRDAHIGQMGYRDMLLYGTMFDGASLRRKLGVEVEFFEMLEIIRNNEQLQAARVDELVEYCLQNWTFEKPCPREVLEKGVRYYLAISQKVKERGYQAVSLIDVDGMKKLEGFPPAMVFMLLSELDGVCTIPENDTLGAATQLMVHYLTGQIAAYLEFYEFFEDRVIIGVPDFVPREVTDGPVTVTPTAFGNFSGSLLNVSKVKTGRITMARLIGVGDRYSCHITDAQGVAPRSWEEAGWTPPAPQLPSLEAVLDTPVEEFAQKVASQHTIIAYGEWREALEDLCKLLDIQVI